MGSLPAPRPGCCCDCSCLGMARAGNLGVLGNWHLLAQGKAGVAGEAISCCDA